MHLLPREDVFQAVQRQVIPQLADYDVGQQARTGQALVDRLRWLGGHRDIRVVTLGITLRAGVLVPNVLEHLEAGREVFELLAHLGADPTTFIPTGWTNFLSILQIVLDLDALELLGQLLTTVRMTALHTTRHQRLAGFCLNTRLIQRHLFYDLAKQQQLPRVEGFTTRAVVATQQSGDGGFDCCIDCRLPLGL